MDAKTSSKAEPLASSKRSQTFYKSNSRKQLSSFILFASTVIFLNLSPPQQSSDIVNNSHPQNLNHAQNELSRLELPDKQRDNIAYWLSFIEMIFNQPTKGSQLRGKRNQIVLAEAKIIGKIAKMWYIKKKIRKFNKKLKKHTIAVPVITAIPIYEHSY